MQSPDIARGLIEVAFTTLFDHIAGTGDPEVRRGTRLQGLTIEAALSAPPDAFRSVLGTLKHIGGWAHVYHSYAFDAEPKHWNETSWPRGLRDSIVASQDYLDEVIKWIESARQNWLASLGMVSDEDLESARPLHWGAEATLFNIVLMVANHVVYHTGEFNQLLAIYKEEGWEEGEQVEENHLPSDGHRVIPIWMTETTGA